MNVLTGSIRLISDISFWINESEGTTTSINSTNGYILGDSQNHNLTVLDGNGMTIEGVNIKNYDTPTQTSVGLFSEIYYSIIKNANII